MKKIILTALTIAVMVCSLALFVSAESAYLEELSADLKTGDNDTVTHFVVFDGEEYYGGGNGTINSLNRSAIESELNALGVSGEIGTKYLIKYIFPASYQGQLVTKIDFNTGELKGSGYFRGVCGAVVLPGTVNTVTDMNNSTGAMRSFDFGKDSKIKVIPYCFMPASKSLREIKNFPKNLDVIDQDAFRNTGNAFKGEIYLNAKTIKYKAFDNALSLVTGIVFGPDTKVLEDQALSCGETSTPVIKYIEFQCDVTQLSMQESLDSTKGVFYFGLKSGSQRRPLSSLACIVLSNPAQAGIANGTSFQSVMGKSIYFNQNSENPVVTAHSYSEYTYSYKDFYTSGSQVRTCADCGKTQQKSSPAIFTALGYSKSTFDGASITFGIRINFAALDAYNSAVTEDLRISELGLLAANKEAVVNTIFDSDMNVKSGAVKVDLIAHRNNYADIKLVGITGENDGVPYDYSNKELYLTAYAIVGGEAVYFDNDTDSKALQNSITYNSIEK